MAADTGAVPSVLVDFDAVAAIIGRKADSSTRTYIHRLVKRGDWPAPIQLTPNGRIFWRRAEVEEHIATRPRVKYAPEARDAA